MENAFPKSIKSARQDWKFYLRVLQLHASVNSAQCAHWTVGYPCSIFTPVYDTGVYFAANYTPVADTGV